AVCAGRGPRGRPQRRTSRSRGARIPRSSTPHSTKRGACCVRRSRDGRPGRRMKALVLAGGRGTRLRPITHTSAKQLVPVANKPVLFYGLEALRDAGIRQVGIVVGDPREMLRPDHGTGEMTTVMVNSQWEIRQAVGDGSRFGLEVEYLEQEAPL